MRVMNAEGQMFEVDVSALGAINGDIGPIQPNALSIEGLFEPIKPETRKSAGSGSATTSPTSAGTTPTSKPSEPPTKPSNKHWRKPKDAKGFASQANEVATMILNGEIDLEAARAYSGVSRTMAQVLSAEVYRARFLQQAPDLTFEEET